MTIRGLDMKRQLEAVEKLRRYDHAFLSEEGVAEFAKAFGVQLTPSRHAADGYHNPKGLTLHNGAKSAIGMCACVLAQVVCRRLGVLYESKFGRGSQLRACCDALEVHFRFLEKRATPPS